MVIQYKVKVKEFDDGKKYINYKKTLNCNDFVGRPCDHEFHNTDLFPQILNLSHRKVIGEYKKETRRNWELDEIRNRFQSFTLGSSSMSSLGNA